LSNGDVIGEVKICFQMGYETEDPSPFVIIVAYSYKVELSVNLSTDPYLLSYGKNTTIMLL
jgi:hypothetical protein